MHRHTTVIHRLMIVLAALLCASVLQAAPTRSQGATPVADAIALPAPTGPYAVGRMTLDWVDHDRTETFTDEPTDQRELAIWVWYPAAADAGVAPYLPGQWGTLVGAALGFDPNRIVPHATAGAPLASEQAAYPVLIFSPGAGFFAPVYATLAEELASHGYVVVGVTHTYNASVTVFADDRVAPALPAAQLAPTSPDELVAAGVAIIDVHAADVRFVLDQLEEVNQASGPFEGRLDLSRIGIFGHSLGGGVAAETCRVDRRCDAGVNMDGALFGEAATVGVPVPFLLIMSDHPPCAEQAASGLVTVEQCEANQAFLTAGWEAVFQSAQPGYWLVVEGSRHGSFSDAPFLPAAPEIVAPLLGGATITPERGWRVTSDYLLAFFDQHLNGNPAPLLDGPAADYPEVEFVEGGS